MSYQLSSLPARVASKIRVDAVSGCWVWLAATTTNGYGHIKVGPNRSVRSHRLVYEALVGPIPKGLYCDHVCRNRRCANPTHIELVTNLENLQRGSARRTHCKQGHPLIAGNVRIRRTATSVRRICNACRALYKRQARRRRGLLRPARRSGPRQPSA